MPNKSKLTVAQFVKDLTHVDLDRVEEKLGSGYVRLNVSEAERRQAKHDIRSCEDALIEMLRNSRDAGATRIYVATQKHDDMRLLTVIDNGAGIPPALHKTIFEARVTGKLESFKEDEWGVHGRGMALFSIKETAKKAAVVFSDKGKGAAIQTLFDTNTIGERANQSAWPNYVRSNAGIEIVGGTHNFAWHCVEFALSSPDIKVFLGSPAEIVARLREDGEKTQAVANLLFVDDSCALNPEQKLLYATKALELVNLSEELGLPISERTAHRILAGKVRSSKTVIATLTHTKRESAPQNTLRNLSFDHRGLKFSTQDSQEFLYAVENAFAELANKYYLEPQAAPKLRIGSDKITVSIPFTKE